MPGAGGHRRRPTPLVRLIVLNYNGGRLVLDSVDSLTRLDWPAERLEIVVVDNHSTDRSDLDVERGFPSVRVIRSPSNVGFAANNLALADLTGIEFVGLVNNDATVDDQWLRELVTAFDVDPNVGAACPRILFAPRYRGVTITSPTFRAPGDGRQLGVRVSGLRVAGLDTWDAARFGLGFFAEEQGPENERRFRWTGAEAAVHLAANGAVAPAPTVALRLASTIPTPAKLTSGGNVVDAPITPHPRWVDIALGGDTYDVVNNAGSIIGEDGFGADRGFLEPDAGQFDSPADVGAWCGAGVLFSRGFLEDVGLFDERFFLYYEDTDLSWRGRQRGWRYRYVPGAIQRHHHAATAVEGSPLFEFYVARNRLLMLAKHAPWRTTARASARFLRDTAALARSDILRPLVHARRPDPRRVELRTRSFIGYARLLPGVVRERQSRRVAARP